MTPPTTMPDTSLLIVEDDTPVDIYDGKQQRLLVEPLYTSWQNPGKRPFMALANVGLFFEYTVPPLVPDMMLSLNVPEVENRRESDHRSYFCWIVGKMPDVVIEIVSDRIGGEDTTKMRTYAERLIPYYVIYDPVEHLESGMLRAYALNDGEYEPIDPTFFPEVGLGLKLWTGLYEFYTDRWLRWCDANGEILPTGREGAEREIQRFKKYKQLAEQYRQQADEARQRTERYRQMADERSGLNGTINEPK